MKCYIQDRIPAKWKARWVDPELCRPRLEIQRIPGQRFNPNPSARIRKIEHRVGASYLCKEFDFHADAGKSVMLYATAHGIYDIWINGTHLDGFLLAPGTTQYDKHLMVQCYEISELLSEGENRILVSIGDGWYRGCIGFEMDINTFGDDLAFLCQIEADGEVILTTDASWEAAQDGPLGLNDMMRGETYDARVTQQDMRWHGVIIRDYGYDNLIPTECPPILEHERFPAVLLTTPAGETVLDFGQNFAGYVRVMIPRARGGERLVLTHGETLDENGNFTISSFQNPGKPECDQRVTYICKAGENDYKPTKCYFGFRYVKVESEFPITGEMFTGIAIYSDMRQTARFTCGDKRVNQLFRNAMWSMKSNFVGVPTDCPTREKGGFTGDAQMFCDTALYLMDSAPVFQSWLREVEVASSPKVFRAMAPDHRKPGYFENSAGWCDAIELIPWRIWKRTGDAACIGEHYNAMEQWLNFCIQRAKKIRPENLFKVPWKLQRYFADVGFAWGEWLEPGADATKETIRHIVHGEPEVSTAYLSYGCMAMSQMADAIGNAEDAAYYEAISEKAKAAYRAAFLPVKSERQCLYVRPIAMNLLTEEEKLEAAAALAEAIRRNGNHLNTGFLSTAMLCRVLSDYGQTRTAYDLLLQEDCPGWLYPVSKGATTIWEGWDGINAEGKPSGSLNHYTYGAVAGWLMDSVCGIRIERGKITIAPHPDRRLGFAEAEYDSPLGTIRAGWRYDGDQIIYQVSLPEGQTASLILMDGSQRTISGAAYSCSVQA